MSTIDAAPRREALATNRQVYIVCVAVAAVFLCAALPLIWSGYDKGRGAADQNRHYLRAVIEFSRQWPEFELGDYSSATTPGYLLAMAAVHRYLSADVRVLRTASAGVTVMLLIILAAAVARRTPPLLAFALCFPVVCSLYVFSSGAWILPDNAGWCGVLAILLLALRPSTDARFMLLGGSLLLAVVMIRQIHLWAAAVIWLAAWLGPETSAAAPQHDSGWVQRVFLGLLATLPAVLVAIAFHRLWGGWAPPRYQGMVQGGNLAVPPIILANVAVAGLFFLPLFASHAKALLSNARTRAVLTAGVILGGFAGLLPETSYESPARSSGLWNAVRVLPTVFDRSPLIVMLSTLGGAMLVLWFVALNSRDRWIWLGAWIAFILAQSASSLAWQRYYEPFVLIMFALAASRIGQEKADESPPPWAAAGPVLLAVMLATVTFLSLT